MLLKHAIEKPEVSGVHLECLQVEKDKRKKALTVAVEKGNRADPKRVAASMPATISLCRPSFTAGNTKLG